MEMRVRLQHLARNTPPSRGLAMHLDDTFPVQWTGTQAVVTLPDHIDVSNAGRVREVLLAVRHSHPAQARRPRANCLAGARR
jgi:hypothetical protein